MKTGQLLLKYG